MNEFHHHHYYDENDKPAVLGHSHEVPMAGLRHDVQQLVVTPRIYWDHYGHNCDEDRQHQSTFRPKETNA